MGKLSALKVSKLRRHCMVGDGAGLWFRVSDSGRSWVLRYMAGGVAHGMGLGSYPLVSLAQARERSADARRLLLDGIDPIQARRAEKTKRTEAVRGVTLKRCAIEYVEAHSGGWRNKKHREQVMSVLERFVFPQAGALDVATIGTADIHRILDPLWKAKPETASRLRGRLERILDFAKAKGWRTGDNGATWHGGLAHLLQAQPKSKRVKHHPAMPYQDVPAFMATLRTREGIGARALEVLVLTASRTGEIIGAKQDEMDFAAKAWSIPGSRMKAGRPHRVPLSDRVIRILQDLPHEKDSAFVFVGAREGLGLSNMTMLKILKSIAPSATCHGMRSAFRDWAAEATQFQGEVAEAALAHVPSAVEAAYRRGELFAKRAQLMQAWADFCGA